MFRLEERSLEELPIRITRTLELGAGPPVVFAVLADHIGWPGWFDGMKRARVDGDASGVGALRTVWVPPTRVQERFVCWDEGERLTFHIVASSVPGLRAMTEDWRLEPHDAERTRLTIDIGVEPVRWLRWLSPVVEAIVRRSTAGAAGIQRRFPVSH